MNVPLRLWMVLGVAFPLGTLANTEPPAQTQTDEYTRYELLAPVDVLLKAKRRAAPERPGVTR
jgi:hypothetical protein